MHAAARLEVRHSFGCNRGLRGSNTNFWSNLTSDLYLLLVVSDLAMLTGSQREVDGHTGEEEAVVVAVVVVLALLRAENARGSGSERQ